jgi:uridylate kinase
MAAITRVLLKLSGEALMGPDAFGYHADTMAGIVGQIKDVVEMGT